VAEALDVQGGIAPVSRGQGYSTFGACSRARERCRARLGEASRRRRRWRPSHSSWLRMYAELQFGHEIGRSAYSGRCREAGRPIPIAPPGVLAASGSIRSTSCEDSSARDHAGIGCESVQRILAHAPADAAGLVTARTAGGPDSGPSPLGAVGENDLPQFITPGNQLAASRSQIPRLSVIVNTGGARTRRRGLGASGEPGSRTMEAHGRQPPVGYASGAGDPRRVMARSPLSVGTRRL